MASSVYAAARNHGDDGQSNFPGLIRAGNLFLASYSLTGRCSRKIAACTHFQTKDPHPWRDIQAVEGQTLYRRDDAKRGKIFSKLSKEFRLRRKLAAAIRMELAIFKGVAAPRNAAGCAERKWTNYSQQTRAATAIASSSNGADSYPMVRHSKRYLRRKGRIPPSLSYCVTCASSCTMSGRSSQQFDPNVLLRTQRISIIIVHAIQTKNQLASWIFN